MNGNNVSPIAANHFSNKSLSLLRILNEATEALGIEMLMERAAWSVSKATLLRRLEELRSAGLVERSGKARATRRWIPDPLPHPKL